LHIAVRALGLQPGAEVILPSFTFSALLNVILQEGLRPKFVDIDPATYNTTPELVADAITPRTRLILAVHTFGIPVDSGELREIANRHGVHLIEDACEALGADARGRKVGIFGDAGMFAFYPNKQITTGEGGMLVTSDEKLAEHARRLRNQGRDPRLDWHQHADVGFSYRLSDINCALGISQLARIESIVERRQKLAEIYGRELAQIGEVVCPALTSSIGRISWFVYPVRLAVEFSRKDRDWICESLTRKGIGAGRYFPPLHWQPVLATHPFGKLREGSLAEVAEVLTETEFIADRVIALPFFNELTEREIQEVCDALEESIHELRRKT
jgi:perosamine synthetase